MKKNMVISQEFSSVVNNITSKFNIEQIYVNTYEREFAPYELIILVSNKYVKTLGDLAPRITNSIRDYPDYRVACYVAFQAKDKITTGNLFLFTSCVPDKLIYKKQESEFNIIADNFDFDRFLKKVYALRDKEFQKVDEFKEGYFFYKDKGHLSMASFMIHQAIELTYRYLEVLLSAKERIKHSIRGHHHYLKEITTMYVSIFDEENDTDQHLLNVLEDIYRATRYEDNFDVKLETLNLLEVKLNQLNDNAIKIYDAVILSFENYITARKEKLEANIEKDNITIGVPNFNLDPKAEPLIEKLKILLPEDVAIYLFGYRTRSFMIDGINTEGSTYACDYYFDLLIVSESDIRERMENVQASINQDLGISVVLLLFTHDQIQKQLDENSPFFHRTLQYVAPLYSTNRKLLNWEFHKQNGQRTHDEISAAKTKWYQRENNASGFYNGGKAIDHSEEVEIKVLLYNQAIEQACLGLLEYFYDYTPYQYNIKHLFSLCASLWQFPNDIFPRNTEEEKSLFDEFAQTVQDTRYQGWSMVDWDEAYRYDQRCERFLEQCSNLVRGE